MESSNMMQNSVELVKAARAKGAKIVHVPISFSDSYNEIAPEAYGILANVKAGISANIALYSEVFHLIVSSMKHHIEYVKSSYYRRML